MNRFFERYYLFFKKRPFLNIVFVLIYFLLVVLPHEEIGKMFASTLDEPLGRAQYNRIILVAGFLGFLVYLSTIWKGVQIHKERKTRVVIYLTTTIVLIIAAINILMVINVEMIHFIQYAIMAILLFPLFSNFGTTLFFTILLGALDEAYQYWVLAPFRTDYYDFNDIIINLLGAALGLILLFAVGLKSEVREPKWYQSPVFMSTIGLVLILGTLYALGILAIYPIEGKEQPLFLLVKKIQTKFWTVVPPDVKFHVLNPLWGSLITITLFQFYRKLDYKIARVK